MAIRTKPGISLVALALVAALLCGTLEAYAQAYMPGQELPKPTKLEMQLTKLGRGLSNIMFGWAEIPLTFDKKLKQDKPLAYLVGVAPVLGATRAAMRMGAGVYEVITFGATKEGVNYGPVLEPEFIF